MVVKLKKGFGRYSKLNASIIDRIQEKRRDSQELGTLIVWIGKGRSSTIQFYRWRQNDLRGLGRG